MAAPNLNSTSMVAVSKVDIKTPGATSEQTLTTNATSSAHTYISLSLTAMNSGGGGLPVTVNWYDGSNNNYIINSAIVPGNAQMELAPTRKLLLEGWTVKVTTPSSTANITFTHHYLDCS